MNTREEKVRAFNDSINQLVSEGASQFCPFLIQRLYDQIFLAMKVLAEERITTLQGFVWDFLAWREGTVHT